MHGVVKAFEEHMDTISASAVERVVASGHPFYTSLPPAVLRGAVAGAFQMVLADLKQGSDTSFATFLAKASHQRVEQGALPSDVISGFNIGIDTASDFFKQHFHAEPLALAWWFERIHTISQAAAIALSDAMLAEREQRIRDQASLIRQTSSPIIPIYAGIVILPLVGAVDSHRAGQIMENLLQSIAQHGADVVILDITGVPVVDTGVAHYLLQAARAVRLLGAEIVLVGIGRRSPRQLSSSASI